MGTLSKPAWFYQIKIKRVSIKTGGYPSYKGVGYITVLISDSHKKQIVEQMFDYILTHFYHLSMLL